VPWPPRSALLKCRRLLAVTDLASVRHIGADHRARVDATSTLGGGSTFHPAFTGAPPKLSLPPEPKGTSLARVLVVEDEESVSDALSYMLRREGFEVSVASTGTSALTQFDQTGADIVLLDLMLPEMSGTEVCRQLRQRSTVPIIMVTARDSEIDKVVGLEIGADDYVTKPYSPRELVARIRAVLRRPDPSRTPSPGGDAVEVSTPTLAAGPVRMDVERHLVTVDGSSVQLPLKEFELLELLLRNAGRVLTRGQLIDRVWGADYVGDTKTLDVHVKRLRSKVEPEPSTPRHIVTIRGLGYKFETREGLLG
jgi:two-component system, OmpR family, response regulator RegX3